MSWPLVRLGDVVERPIKTVDPRSCPTRTFRYVDISSIDSDYKRIAYPRVLLGRDAPTRARQVIHTGDVLVATTRPYLNSVATVPDDLDGAVCSTGFAVLRPCPNIDAKYLALFVRSPDFIRALAESVQGALYPAVTDRQVLAQKVPLPPLDVQHRTVERLTAQLGRVENLRARAREQLLLIDGFEASVYLTSFKSIVPLTVEAVPPGASAGWRWHLLTDLARLESGHTPSRSRPEWWGGDIGWIQLADIRAADGQVIRHTSETTNPDGIANSAARVLPPDTVVMSRTASVGFVARMGHPMATSQDFVNWVCGPDLDPEFLMHLLIRSRAYIRSLSSGATHKTVYYPTVKAFWICAPDLAEQQAIARRLRGQLAVTARARDSLTAAANDASVLPAAFLRQAFGEVASTA